MAYDIECSMRTADELKKHRDEQMLVLMDMGDDLYCYEEHNTALLCRIWDALHDLMKGIDTCQRLLDIKVDYQVITKELEARGIAKRKVSIGGGFFRPLILILIERMHCRLIRCPSQTVTLT